LLIARIGRGNKVAVAKLLLEVGKANVVLKDNYRRTPLHWAAESGRETVVKVLLNTGKVDVNSKDENGWTPLSLAVYKRHEAVVQLLRSHSDVP